VILSHSMHSVQSRLMQHAFTHCAVCVAAPCPFLGLCPAGGCIKLANGHNCRAVQPAYNRPIKLAAN
jgi:hypothetical protein